MEFKSIGKVLTIPLSLSTTPTLSHPGLGEDLSLDTQQQIIIPNTPEKIKRVLMADPPMYPFFMRAPQNVTPNTNAALLTQPSRPVDSPLSYQLTGQSPKNCDRPAKGMTLKEMDANDRCAKTSPAFELQAATVEEIEALIMQDGSVMKKLVFRLMDNIGVSPSSETINPDFLTKIPRIELVEAAEKQLEGIIDQDLGNKSYAELLVVFATHFGVETLTVAKIVWAESKFDPFSVSSGACIGTGQICSINYTKNKKVIFNPLNPIINLFLSTKVVSEVGSAGYGNPVIDHPKFVRRETQTFPPHIAELLKRIEVAKR